jgi:putative transposase
MAVRACTRRLSEKGSGEVKHRVARLMREHALIGRLVRVTRRQPGWHRLCVGKANQLREAGPPRAPNQHWAGDITYLKTNSRYRYLAVVIDRYSRKLVGWSLSDRRTVALTLRAMRAAIAKCNPDPGLIFHTDRGIAYRSFIFQDLLDAHRMIASMNRPSQTTDNAVVESFFHTLKAEFFRGRGFTSMRELPYGVAGYINHFYNRQRMHSGIGYNTPEEHEQIAA